MLDLTNTQPISKFSPIPDGEYFFEVDQSEIKKTKNGKGEYLKIRLNCLTKGFEGRKMWEQFNINHESEKAQNIGRAQLRAFLDAAGREPKLNEAHELIGIKITAKITTQESAGFDPKNIVTDWVSEPSF